MAKHPRKRHKKDKRKPVSALPLAPEAFKQAVDRAEEAVKSHLLFHEQVVPPITLGSEIEEELGITLTVRALQTLRECFPQEREWFSAVRRYHAFMGLFGHPALSPWVEPNGETTWKVDRAVLFVAATAPLDAKGKFLIKPFCEALERFAKEQPSETTRKDTA